MRRGTNLGRGTNTEQRLRDALARVLAGTATNVKPRHRISVSAVASEAGLSRTAVYKLYPGIVKEIEAAARQNGARSVPRARRRELEVRTENSELRDRVALLLSQNATLLHRAVEAERRLHAPIPQSGVTRLPRRRGP